MKWCSTFQLLEEIVASSEQAVTSRFGSPDSMENIDTTRLQEGKDIIDLVEGGKWSKWQFQRQPAVPGQDVQARDDPTARWRMVGGDTP